MHFRSYIVIFLISLASCSENVETTSVEPPEGLIPEEQIMGIIIDLQILESSYQFRYQRPDVYKNALDSASYYVYDKHGVTKDQYLRSYDYYALNIDKMFLLYEATLDSVNILINTPEQ